MSNTYVKPGYKPALGLYETQTAIGILKKEFETRLSNALNLKRVSAPLFVDPETGLNDNLNGIERAVRFDIKETKGIAEVVHSLAKWKRMALHRYGFSAGEGLYTDMNAIRRDEDMDNIHSIYVDQWDWEKIITPENRNEAYLKITVNAIVSSIVDTLEELKKYHPQITTTLSKDVSFITSQELEDLYPSLTSKAREHEYLKKNKTAFIMKIGDVLESGKKHDGRAPDYDDWSLNGDILFWNDVLDTAFEVSSMGIRVDSQAMEYQLSKENCDERKSLPFHKMVLESALPLTLGGGIGQSRLSMLLLEKIHIGEVQASIWDEDTHLACKNAGICLL
ncbi:MAG: aspartate--ammonia ligase [Proteocatella sp.]